MYYSKVVNCEVLQPYVEHRGANIQRVLTDPPVPRVAPRSPRAWRRRSSLDVHRRERLANGPQRPLGYENLVESFTMSERSSKSSKPQSPDRRDRPSTEEPQLPQRINEEDWVKYTMWNKYQGDPHVDGEIPDGKAVEAQRQERREWEVGVAG